MLQTTKEVIKSVQRYNSAPHAAVISRRYVSRWFSEWVFVAGWVGLVDFGWVFCVVDCLVIGCFWLDGLLGWFGRWVGCYECVVLTVCVGFVNSNISFAYYISFYLVLAIAAENSTIKFKIVLQFTVYKKLENTFL